MYYARGLRDADFRLRDWRPEGEVVFNERHWLAPKIKALFAPDNGRRAVDLINPGAVVMTSTHSSVATRDGRLGRALSHSSTSSAALKGTSGAAFASGLPADFKFSAIALFEPVTLTADRHIWCFGASAATSAGAFASLVTSAASAARAGYVVRASDAGSIVTDCASPSGTDFVVGRPALIGCSSFTETSHAVYAAGVLRDTSATNVNSSRSNLPYFGTAEVRGTGSANALDCIRYLLATFDEALTAEDHLRLYDESPFDLIRSRVFRTYHVLAPPAGAGPTEKTASDSLTPMTAEAKALAAALGRTDSALPMTAEAGALLAGLGRIDSLTPMTAEAKALLATIAAADTLSPYVAEAVALLQALIATESILVLTAESATADILGALDTKSATETLTPMTAEAAGIVATLSAADDLLVVLDQLAALAASVQATDSVLIGWADLGAIVASLAASDGLAPMTAESAALTRARALADTLGVTLTELAAIVASEEAPPLRVLATALAARRGGPGPRRTSPPMPRRPRQ